MHTSVKVLTFRTTFPSKAQSVELCLLYAYWEKGEGQVFTDEQILGCILSTDIIINFFLVTWTDYFEYSPEPEFVND